MLEKLERSAGSESGLRGLSGNQLKLIAVLTMIVDHIGYLISRLGLYGALDLSADGGRLNTWYVWLRTIGRISFPIFLFLVVEGFFHTRNRARYLMRIGIFALISEVPFDLFLGGTMIETGYQNVLWTFFLALGMLALMEAVFRRPIGPWTAPIQLFIVCLTSVFAMILNPDYSYFGIILAALFYWLRGNRPMQCLAGLIIMTGTVDNWMFFLGLAVGFLLIWLYNGTRGKRRIKYLFYWFYPVHLLVLGGIFFACMYGYVR